MNKHMDKFKDFLRLKTNKRGDKNTEGTVEKYKAHVEQFYSLMGINDYKQVTNDLLDEYVIKLRTLEYHKGKTIKLYDSNSLIPKKCAMQNYVEFLAKKMNMPLDWREIKEETLKPEKMRVKPVKEFTDDELNEIFRVSRHNLRDNAILWTLLATGCRRTDVSNINISDIDFKEQTLRVFDTKTKVYKIKSLTDQCIQAIQSYQSVRTPAKDGTDALFTTIYGKRLDTRAYYEIVQTYCSLARITGKRCSPHVFKHTCISKMARAGMSAIEIQQHTGNASLQTLQNYIHLNNWDIKSKVKSALTVEQKDPSYI